MKLLTDGKEAFPEILKCINEAQKSILVNMFIWRGDSIGKTVAEAMLEAADRGVKVNISIDRYGLVLEKSEECTHSFFHERPTLTEKIKIAALKISYPTLAPKNPPKADFTELRDKLLNHPNVSVSRDVFKADHSKYYIFDENTVIMGGINIEDKENGFDISGRRYQDYMVKITDTDEVKAFITKVESGKDILSDKKFTVNSKKLSPKLFEAESTLLDLINGAEKELLIIMAYFSPLPQFITAIHSAWKRGVKIKIVTPEHANFQSDLNRKTVKKLMSLCNNELELHFFKGMVHTKLLKSDKTLTFGSCNITKKAFNQLDELNLTATLEATDYLSDLDASIEKTLSECERITDGKEIKYSVGKAFIEGFLV